MGEYFYKNQIDFSSPDFLVIQNAGRPGKSRAIMPPRAKSRGAREHDLSASRVLIPIGGGKDSIVTLELLKPHFAITPFIINPVPIMLDVSRTAGFPHPVTVRSEIDPYLLNLNRQSYLNGHVPVTAAHIFTSLLAAALNNCRFIAFSNERSSDEGNVSYLGHTINHQYSKTLEFETDISKYLIKNLKFKIKNYSRDHLGLVALGTIADILPLVGINRGLVVHGLKVLRNSSRLGIRALCASAAVSQDSLDTYNIGFILGPRLNAMGRVDHAMESLRLLCTRNPQKASELARKLESANHLRQEKTEAVVSHVESIHADPAWSDGNIPKLLYVYHASYEEGVIGIAAGRLVDKYHRPAIVLSIGEEYSKASARSISGVNILELLKKAGDGIFKSVGGHPMAAGFTIKTQDVELLGQRLNEISELEISDEVLIKNVRIDCAINLSDVTGTLLSQIVKFAPFGFGNPEPVFETRGVNVLETRLLGKEKNHLKMLVEKDGVTFTAIGFRMGEWYANLSPDLSVNIVYAVEENVWNGNKSLQLKLKSITLS